MLILQDCTLVELYPSRVERGVDIVIDGDKIIAVGQSLSGEYPGAQIKPMNGKLVMPGLVCSHNHFYSGLSRGVMAPIPPCPDFISTLKNLWWRLDRALDEESLYYSGVICALEAIKGGCTSVIDHHASPAFIAGSLAVLRQAFLDTGLRGMTCFETTDRNGGLEELKAGVQENIAFARLIDKEKQSNPQSYLVEAHIGAHAPFTVSDAGLELLRDAIKETGRGLHIHVAEDRYDVAHSHDKYSLDPVLRLEKFGLLNEKTLIAHGLWLSEQEVECLNSHNAFLVHNARSNMNNHVGYNPHLPKVKWAALGTDGIGSDMFEELKFAWFKHRDAGGPLGTDRFLQMLNNGNELLTRNFGQSFGRLAPGYTADITVLDYAEPTPLCADNLAGHMAFGMSSAVVDTVIVAGRRVYEDRAFAQPIAPLYDKARVAAKKMWQRMAAI
ncbi:putative aminohydrolase SsnA [Mixta intestinalis]|jgi:putative selenium metabolism protein SsnA|uniref:8-oxoguanine deaminase n=1 Tax=Mixta intestinalis TaxID=1615494 RepID=A0A6P1Q5V9_9GAMM|nr:putative aminohydrolase SsnA [Mixta intestinalis]QHM73831.1 8-oxoguanine deaminase [Mixta intestinalis]